jgi:hypothetical protein
MMLKTDFPSQMFRQEEEIEDPKILKTKGKKLKILNKK